MAESEMQKRLRGIWFGMRQRCNNPDSKAARWYHDKGIRVCTEWDNSFDSFYYWAIENGYRIGLSIDRINPELDYSPDNCQWLTRSENSQRAHGGGYNNTHPANREPPKQPQKQQQDQSKEIIEIALKLALAAQRDPVIKAHLEGFAAAIYEF